MTSRRAAILLIAGVVVLIAAAIGFWQFGGSQALFPEPTALPGPTETPLPTFGAPPADFTPPPSIEELATQFPELGSVLLNSELSSVYKDFVVAYQKGGIEAARQLAEDRGLLDDQDRVRLTIELDTSDSTELQSQLEDNGVQVLGAYENLLDVAIPLRVVEAAARQGNPGALFDQISQLDHVIRIRLPLPAGTDDDPVPGEGVGVTGAQLWHQTGFTGEGVKVGIVDLGFGGYTRLLGQGLPEHVTARSFVPGIEPEESDEVHGAAVAEIVYEMAPGAELYLAYYGGDDVSFGNAVDWLLSQGVQIISNSTGGEAGPMDGTGFNARVVDAAAAQGVLWVNSAGNEAETHYRGQFTDTDGNKCHEFPDGSEAMGVVAGPSGVFVILNWDDWDAADQDYDLYIYDENGDVIGASEDYQSGESGQAPIEAVINNSVEPETVVYAKICAATANRAVTFDLYTRGYAIEFPVAEHSLSTPADANGAFTVGAVDWATSALTDYSSQGPTNDGRMKPDISAPAGVVSASYAPNVFHGTSASTPHVSGAAALVWGANPDFTADDVRQYLIDNALDVPPAGPESHSGYGALHLPAPPGVNPGTATEVASTQVAIVRTAAPVSRPGSDSDSSATTTIVIGLLCGGFFICGFGLVLVGAVALVVMSRRRSTPPPPPAVPFAPPPPQMYGAPPPMAPPPTDPIPPPSQPVPYAQPRPFGPGATAGPPAGARLTSAAGGLYSIEPTGATLGRAPECEIVLNSSQVSRTHATIRMEGMAWTIRDLGSSNGTFLNSERLEPNVAYRLNSGDQVELGGFGGEKLMFEAG